MSRWYELLQCRIMQYFLQVMGLRKPDEPPTVDTQFTAPAPRYTIKMVIEISVPLGRLL